MKKRMPRPQKTRFNTSALLFVCTLNTCRSIVGHAVFEYIKNQTSLAMHIDSAGIQACSGQHCDPMISDVAAKRGYDLSAYRSTPLRNLNPQSYNWVFIFEQAHYEPVRYWMEGYNKPEYIMTYSEYFGNQEVLMQGTGDAINIYTHIFDLIEDGCLGFYNQLTTETKNDGI